MSNLFVYVVGQEDFVHDFIYKPIKVFLYEEDAQKYCEQKNKYNKLDDPYIYQKIRLYN